MFSYATYLFRAQTRTPPLRLGYDLTQLKAVIADAQLTPVLVPTAGGDVTKMWAGMIALSFQNQKFHDIQRYNDYELQGF